jgi:hypothetical protein
MYSLFRGSFVPKLSVNKLPWLDSVPTCIILYTFLLGIKSRMYGRIVQPKVDVTLMTREIDIVTYKA